MQQFSQAELEKLEHELQKVFPVKAGVEASPEIAFSKDWCTIWPAVKPVLGVLAKFAPFIPAVGPKAALILTALVAAGDAVFQDKCGK